MPGFGPDNPFLVGAASAADRAPPARWPARVLAILATLFVWVPLPGAGHLILGNRRRALRWMALGVVLAALLVVSVLRGWGLVFVISAVAMALAALISLVDTAFARATAPVRLPLAFGLLGAALVIGWLTGDLLGWKVKAFRMPADSMAPALITGDHFMAAKGQSARRGDVIVFAFPNDRKIDYVKRVVAVGGDTVEVNNDVVLVNGQALPRKPIEAPCLPEVPDLPPCSLSEESAGDRRYRVVEMENGLHSSRVAKTVPPGNLFVLGDNRDNSNDSRVWGFVPAGDVRGRASVIWWSRGPDGVVRWDRIGRSVY